MGRRKSQEEDKAKYWFTRDKMDKIIKGPRLFRFSSLKLVKCFPLVQF